MKGFYVLLVTLKTYEFSEKNIITVSKLILQNILMILECNGRARLAVYHNKLMLTEWQTTESLSIELKGFNLDTVWENIISQIGQIQVDNGNTLDEQIVLDKRREKLQKTIERLEKAARTEKQPPKKFDLVQHIKQLKES